MTSRVRFDQELENLKLELIKMGDTVMENIAAGLKSFLASDVTLAEKTVKADKIVNAFEQAIEKDCLRIILKEQPVAKDLRLITAILKMITDLERIGDHAADISKMTIFMERTNKPRPIAEMRPMTEAATAMIKKALASFINHDAVLAEEVHDDDDVVDAYFEQIRDKVADAIRANAIDADYALYAMMVAKYLERIADHAVNIGEWVVFSITGEHKHNLIF
jgi:phosphate transport system protein